MELGNIVKVSVRTLDIDSSPIQVSVKEEATAGEVLQKVANVLGIHTENLPLFSLFECMEAPINRLRDQDIVPFTTGKLHPSPEQRTKLEEYCDPSFPLHGRYVQLCQTLEDYSSVRFRDVIVERDLCVDNFKVPVGTIIELRVTLSGLRLVSGETTLSIVWSRITSWTNVKEGNHLQYEVYSPDSGSRDILAVQTIQAPYLLSTTLEIIAALQKEQSGPAFHTSQVHRQEEGTVTHWDNVLFQA